MSKKIPLTKGKFAIVDDKDEDFIKRLKPYAMKRLEEDKYDAVINVMVKDRGSHISYIHHFLIKPKPNQIVIHKNGNNLDFRKSNLIISGYSIATHKARKRKNRSSIYKGVCFYKGNRKKKYMAYISQNIKTKKRNYLGYFFTEKEAALVYNEKAKELYGEFAYQNKI